MNKLFSKFTKFYFNHYESNYCNQTVNLGLCRFCRSVNITFKSNGPKTAMMNFTIILLLCGQNNKETVTPSHNKAKEQKSSAQRVY